MARFVLDVANINKEEAQIIMERVCNELSDEIVTIILADVTNENQFYNQDDIEDGKTNALTQDQIDAFNNEINKV